MGSVPPIDWNHYRKVLPHLDVAAMQRDYEQFMSTIPNVPYDEAADAKAHAADREVFDGLAAYAEARASELVELKAEAIDHKLTDHYTLSRLFQRFDGLYEHEWAEFKKLNFVGNLRTLSEASEDLSAEDKKKVLAAMADRLAVKPSDLGAADL